MRGLVISATAMTNVGTGTFIREPFVRNPYVDWSLGFQPSYTFEDATALSLQGGITQEITNADGVNDPNQVFLSDLRLGVQRPLYTFERSKTAISGGLRVSLPTSLASRTETLYTALQAQASVSQPLGDFILTFTTSGRKNFHKYTTSVVDIFADRGAVQAFAREGGNERISAVAVSTGNNNVEWVWSNSLGVNYGVTPEVNLGLSYTLAHSWTYDSFPVDEFSGVGAREGRGQRDASAASLSGSYQVMENVGLAAGLQTISTPRQADGRTLRFPFYEFQSTAFNLSTIFVSVTFTEPVRL